MDSNPDLSQDAAPPCVLVIFGITGDLAKRLLLPSLYNLAAGRSLADGFRLLGVGRKDWGDGELRDHLAESVREFWGPAPDDGAQRWLEERTFYQRADFDDDASFETLRARAAGFDGSSAGNLLFYLALAPDFISRIAGHLCRAGLLKEDGRGWRRLIVEKPFGHDLPSAVALNSELQQCLREEQIYRIDHFAGKDAVQDLAVFRFSNAVIEPLWHRSLIDSVQITVAETVGVEKRADFYEKSGALRDMVPNHLAELLSLIAMEPPVSFSAAHMRDKQVELLESIRKLKPSEVSDHAVRGQYSGGRSGGRDVPGYRAEAQVGPQSSTETFVALKVEIDNWRWAGVPFFLRTGKRLTTALTEIAVRFRQPPACLFPHKNRGDAAQNEFVFNLQPTQGIHLTFGAKTPGLETDVLPADMGYQFPDGPFGTHAKGYERLLRDAMLGNSILFQGAEFVTEGWRWVQPLLEAWRSGGSQELAQYPAGSAGPQAADELLQRTGHAWRPLPR